jgi:simple sugar transport system substrate-binding protein
MEQRNVIRRTRPLFVGLLLAMGVAALVTASLAGARPAATSAGALKIIYISNGPSSTSYNAIINNGLKQAGKDFGVQTVYRGPQSGQQFGPNDVLRLLNQAIAQKPDGLIISNVAPAALNPAIRKAVASGIPVVLANTGIGETARTGALTYVGNDEVASGRLGGKLMSRNTKHVLLVTGPDSVPLIKQRNDGFDAGYSGKVTRLTIPLADFSNVTKMRNEIEIALRKDKTIDGAFSIGSILNPPMIAARDSLGSRAGKVHLASIDLGTPVIAALKAKRYDFALDQQFYLEGYLPTQILVQNIRYALAPAQATTPTGPTVVDASNVGKIASLVPKGIR